jgi:HSP20 family protein
MILNDLLQRAAGSPFWHASCNQQLRIAVEASERSFIMALPTRVTRSAGVDPFDYLTRELGGAMGRLFNVRDMFENGTGGTGLAPYGVDVREDADHIYVEAELPGFKKDEIDITLENSTLTISAERKEEFGAQQPPTGGGKTAGNGTNAGEHAEYLLRERRFTRFARSFTLPPTVDEGKVDAKLSDGVLRITLNKREETKPRKISVA